MEFIVRTRTNTNTTQISSRLDNNLDFKLENHASTFVKQMETFCPANFTIWSTVVNAETTDVRV